MKRRIVFVLLLFVFVYSVSLNGEYVSQAVAGGGLTGWVGKTIQSEPTPPYETTFSTGGLTGWFGKAPSAFSLVPNSTIVFDCNGDQNDDGDITPQDALIVFECYFGSGDCNCSDANGDGEVTPADALYLFQKYLEVSFLSR